MQKWSLESTIVAPASAPRGAARAVLRLSGGDTIRILRKIFRPDTPEDLFQGPNRTVQGTLTADDAVKVRAWVWIFHQPHSYTGQDLAEIHLPGNPSIVKLIEQTILANGVEPAQAGEFTARAYLLEKITLTQAEAINTLVRAENDAQVQAALNLLKGKLNDELTTLYNELTIVAGLVEANIDFSEEDIELIDLTALNDRVHRLQQRVKQLLADAVDGDTLNALPAVFLVGAANAGKSSLLNALTGIDRAICSTVPGATRDMLSAVWKHHQREVMLVDTAGAVATPLDALTDLAIALTQKYLAAAALIVLVIDAQSDLDNQLHHMRTWNLPAGKIVAAVNKIDLLDESTAKTIKSKSASIFPHVVVTSATQRTGLEKLTATVFDRLGENSMDLATHQLALNRRQRHALNNALDALKQCLEDIEICQRPDGQFGFEIIASSLHQATDALAQLLGKDPRENVLTTLFSQFCIGK